MDNLKIYAKSERDLNALISTVSYFSSDIDMTINVNKSPKLVVMREKVVSSEGYSLVNVGTIPNLNGLDRYKYLGIFHHKPKIDILMNHFL